MRRREVWLPTWRGWLLLLALGGSLAALVLLGAYPFLAVNAPLGQGILVMEGWAGPTTIRTTAEVLDSRRYSECYSTGGPISPEAPDVALGTYAAAGAARLRKLGYEMVIPVPSQSVRKDRTYASAVALRSALQARKAVPGELTVLTQGPHARRTRLLFQRAFGETTRVGVIAAPEREYDPQRWWTTSEGFRSVTGEAIAYGYARLFFWKHET